MEVGANAEELARQPNLRAEVRDKAVDELKTWKQGLIRKSMPRRETRSTAYS